MIKVENITKKFDDYKALDNITCNIPEGCIYGMVGSNGAGKSTFLRVISGIYRPEAGTAMIDEQPVWENSEVKGKIAFVPDDLFFLHGASMDRMASLYRASYPDFDDKRFQYLTETFKLNRTKNIATFSKGMKRQAATILAISSKPKYLFMDETFDGLDPVMRNLVKKLICQDVEERKATAIMTSHSLRELEDTCDQLALLHKGGLIFESDISNLKTSLFKVQVAYSEEYDRTRFEGIDGMEVMHFSKQGSVANIIVRGDRENVVRIISSTHPILVEVLPLTLEEVFTYEMEALGYAFGDVLMDQEV